MIKIGSVKEMELLLVLLSRSEWCTMLTCCNRARNPRPLYIIFIWVSYQRKVCEHFYDGFTVSTFWSMFLRRSETLKHGSHIWCVPNTKVALLIWCEIFQIFLWDMRKQKYAKSYNFMRLEHHFTCGNN